MVKVQVCHDNVLDIIGGIAKPGDLTKCAVPGILVDAKIQLKKANHTR
jgi:hypothetical protein